MQDNRTMRAGLTRREMLSSIMAATALTAVGTTTWAQEGFPSQTITIICPYATGATTDTVSRIVAQGLSEELGSTVIVENRAGAGGNIGSAAAAKAEPDGYTLLLGAMGPLAINPALYADMGFDPVTELAPLGLAASVPLVLVTAPGITAGNVDELVELLRKDETLASFASAGAGTPMHLAGELFAKAAGLQLTHIPYRGSAPAITDVMGGQVPFMFDALVNVLPQIKGGTLKAIATTAASRPALLSDVPTLKEAGYDVVVSGWYGFLIPAATPEAIRLILTESLEKVLGRTDIRGRLAELGSDPVDPRPEVFRALIQSESARWQPLVRSLGLTAN